MSHSLDSVTVENPEAGHSSKFLSNTFHRDTSNDKGRIRSVLSLFVLIGEVIKALTIRRAAVSLPASDIKIGETMSSPAPAEVKDNSKQKEPSMEVVMDDATGSKKRSLDRLLNQPPKVVTTDTEDFFEKTRGLSPEEYSREFEKTVNGHMGFTRISTSKSVAGSMKRAAGSHR